MKYIYIFLFIFFVGCGDDDSILNDPEDTIENIEIPDDEMDSSDDQDTANSIYFPPIGSDTWETITATELGWDANSIDELDTYLEENNTKAFIILKDGKIVIENYYQDTDASTNLQWNSAGKTLTASVVGIAQEEGLLDLEESTTSYLGQGWTAMTEQQESQITIRNQLTMTTGGDYNVDDTTCLDPECLLYLNAPDTEWYYHNAFYVLLQDVITAAMGDTFNSYFNEKIKEAIGMNGAWVTIGNFKVYFSTARSMARFGLLNLNHGAWEDAQIITPGFFTEMTTPSQSINEAYGYLWWLNGQDSFRLPGTTETFTGKLIPSAPDDLIAGLGRNDQKLYIVPSEGLVVIRLGDASDASLPGPSGFDTDLWEKISAVIN